jgi:pimeloyl-ACP methyl ester carboxylesterase
MNILTFTELKAAMGLILSIFLEIAVIPLVVLFYPFTTMQFNPLRLPKECKRVTLLVHGFCHNSSAWFLIRQQLVNYKELGPIFTIDLGSPFQSIGDYTKTLDEQIEKIRKMMSYEELEINLVGHSMGGLVCSNYAASLPLGSPVKVIKIVTIASPLQGTPIAHVARFCPCAQEMIPNNPFLLNLNTKIQAISKAKGLFHIGCQVDLIVDKSNTYFVGSQNHREITHFGHYACLLAPSTVAYIIEGLLSDE